MSDHLGVILKEKHAYHNRLPVHTCLTARHASAVQHALGLRVQADQ